MEETAPALCEVVHSVDHASILLQLRILNGCVRPLILADLLMTSPQCHNPTVLKELNLSLRRGERLLISGPSDVGKSLAYYRRLPDRGLKDQDISRPSRPGSLISSSQSAWAILVASRPITLFGSFSSATHGRNDKGFDSSVATDSVRSAERSGCDRTRRGR